MVDLAQTQAVAHHGFTSRILVRPSKTLLDGIATSLEQSSVWTLLDE